MKTRIVHTKKWEDTWHKKLPPLSKILWDYLLTNSRANIAGVFELSDEQILFDTSINQSKDYDSEHDVDYYKKLLEPKALFFKGWVRVVNVDKYNNYKNSPKNLVAFAKEISYVPEDVREYFGIVLDTSMDTPRNKKSEIQNQKPEIESKKYIPSEKGKSFAEHIQTTLAEKFGKKLISSSSPEPKNLDRVKDFYRRAHVKVGTNDADVLIQPSTES